MTSGKLLKEKKWRRGQDSNLHALSGGGFQDRCTTNYATPPNLVWNDDNLRIDAAQTPLTSVESTNFSWVLFGLINTRLKSEL